MVFFHRRKKEAGDLVKNERAGNKEPAKNRDIDVSVERFQGVKKNQLSYRFGEKSDNRGDVIVGEASGDDDCQDRFYNPGTQLLQMPDKR